MISNIPCPCPPEIKPTDWQEHLHTCLNTLGETDLPDWHVCGTMVMGKRCGNVFYYRLEETLVK